MGRRRVRGRRSRPRIAASAWSKPPTSASNRFSPRPQGASPCAAWPRIGAVHPVASSAVTGGATAIGLNRRRMSPASSRWRGLSRRLATELGRAGIRVTTVAPGPMRTGSPRGAGFKGRHRDEFAWFATTAALLVVSASALCAAAASSRRSAARGRGRDRRAGDERGREHPGDSSAVNARGDGLTAIAARRGSLQRPSASSTPLLRSRPSALPPGKATA